MRNVLVIAWSDIARVLRERESLFWLFVGPLIFTVFFGLLFRPQRTAPPGPGHRQPGRGRRRWCAASRRSLEKDGIDVTTRAERSSRIG